MTDLVRVGMFSLPAPMLVAQDRGIFRDHGLEVENRRVASSDEQFRDFAAGRYDLLLTAFDNVANYHLNADNPVGRPLAVRAVLSVDAGMGLTVMAAPGIRRLADLRGRRVSVDARASGFAFVLFGLLEGAGLDVAEDVEVQLHGGVLSRFGKLEDGQTDATLLSNGLEEVASRAGFVRLATSAELVSPYAGSVAAAADPWLEASDAPARFRSAYEEALSVVRDPAHRDDVVRVVAAARDLSTEVAGAIVSAELGPLGLTPGEVDPAAARNTLALRQRFAGFEVSIDIDALSRPGSPLIAG